MHHPTERITHTTAFVTQVVEHWLEREIAQWVLFTDVQTYLLLISCSCPFTFTTNINKEIEIINLLCHCFSEPVVLRMSHMARSSGSKSQTERAETWAHRC